ncbi:MAG: hypothetical protein PHN89_03885 [Candidatus Pacebacteria bacterium]|nr:hypothetical protein [Candidatus Paceibacterota bacterium]
MELETGGKIAQLEKKIKRQQKEIDDLNTRVCELEHWIENFDSERKVGTDRVPISF